MDITRQIKRLFPKRKIGHGGTLDPFACGVLPIAVGEATKLLPWLMQKPKTYHAQMLWGQDTDTLDLTGQALRLSAVRPSKTDVQEIMPQFMGDILQQPPMYAACKVQGVRAYKRARAHESFALSHRPMTIYDLKILQCNQKILEFSCTCGTGTYVRSLAQDIAHTLGTCGHLISLRRTRVGPFEESCGWSLDETGKISNKYERNLSPMHSVLDDIPELFVSPQDAEKLRQGRTLQNATSHQGWVACFSGGQLVAMGQAEDGVIHPKRVINEIRRI